MKNTCDVTLTLCSKGFSLNAASFIFLNMLCTFMYIYIYILHFFLLNTVKLEFMTDQQETVDQLEQEIFC